MSFEESAARGDALGTLRYAAVFASLWAIGNAWSSAIRETTRAVLPDDTLDVVLAELLAAALTTVFGISISLVAARKWCHSPPPPPPPPRGRR